MTVEQIKKAMPDVAYYQPDDDNSFDSSFGLQNFKISECKFDVSFEFKQKYLNSVTLNLRKGNADSDNCIYLINNGLESKYGQEYKKSYINYGEIKKWQTKENIKIVEFWASFKAINKVIFSVEYLNLNDSKVESDL